MLLVVTAFKTREKLVLIVEGRVRHVFPIQMVDGPRGVVAPPVEQMFHKLEPVLIPHLLARVLLAAEPVHKCVAFRLVWLM